MIECEATVKKWGNSFGIVLPKEIVDELEVSAEDKVKVIITSAEKKTTAGMLFGSLKNWKTPSEALEKIADNEFGD